MSFSDSLGSAADSELTSIPVVGNIFSGFDKSREEDQIKKDMATRPKYTTPDAYTEMLQNARAQTTGQMPGYTQTQQSIDRQLAFGGKQIQDLSTGGGNSLADIQKLHKNMADMYSKLSLENNQYHTERYNNLQGVLNKGVGISDQQFEYNQNQPWQQQMNWDINKYQATEQNQANQQKNTYALAGNFLGTGNGGSSQPQTANMSSGMDSLLPNAGNTDMGSLPDPNLYKDIYSNYTPKPQTV